jgi:hypothetical protein
MHFASDITLSGIALSGVPIISFRTSADFWIRFSTSDVSSAQLVPAMTSTDTANMARQLVNLLCDFIAQPPENSSDGSHFFTLKISSPRPACHPVLPVNSTPG